MEKIKLLIRSFSSVFFFSTVLFICAGKLNYFQGWIYVFTTTLTTVTTFFVTRNESDLLNERANAKEGATWDKIILGSSAIIFLLTIIISGLDTGRNGWSPELHWSFYALGISLTITGHSIFLTAQKQNKYFSSVFRIQTDRGHTVCDTGLYKIVRHPGYLGMTISLMGLPLLTGSLWSGIPTLFAIVLLWVRTYIEDKTLCEKLKGYLDYTKETRYKLIPFIW
jgi:protein-S-isoprenylcysteine O-methyltransferase Ste14